MDSVHGNANQRTHRTPNNGTLPPPNENNVGGGIAQGFCSPRYKKTHGDKTAALLPQTLAVAIAVCLNLLQQKVIFDS